MEKILQTLQLIGISDQQIEQSQPEELVQVIRQRLLASDPDEKLRRLLLRSELQRQIAKQELWISPEVALSYLQEKIPQHYNIDIDTETEQVRFQTKNPNLSQPNSSAEAIRLILEDARIIKNKTTTPNTKSLTPDRTNSSITLAAAEKHLSKLI